MECFPDGSVVKNRPASAGDAGSIPVLGRSPGEGDGHLLYYSFLENLRDGRTWEATAHGKEPARLLCLWDFPGKNIGEVCHFLLQGIFPT